MSELIREAIRREKYRTTRITTYEQLEAYVKPWAHGEGHTFLVVLGRPGCLKSSTIKAAIGKRDYLYLQGDVFPKGLYRDLWLYRNCPVLLDDIGINGANRSILMQITDNYETRSVHWPSGTPIKIGRDSHPKLSGDDPDLDEKDDDDHDEGRANGGKDTITLPLNFRTSSQVCVITNEIERLTSMAGLLSRSYIIEFDPPVGAVLQRCKSFIDVDVWAWAKQHEKLLPGMDVRDLAQAGVDKQQGHDWLSVLRSRYIDPRSQLGAYLSVRDKFSTGEERVNAWIGITKKSRAEYYRTQEDYREIFPERNLPRGRNATPRSKSKAKR